MQEDNRQESENCVPKGSCRHDIAVVRPTQHRHVADHESNEKEYSEPNGRVGHGQAKGLRHSLRGQLNSADLRHTALEQQVSRVRAHYHGQDHDQGLKSQPLLAWHFGGS